MVPSISEDLYHGIVRLADASPKWLQLVGEVGTELGLVILAGLVALAFWRARTGTTRVLTTLLLGAVATVLAYMASELTKLAIGQDRPCRNIPGTIAECPPVGDWSFPSNHATLAVSAAFAVIMVWRSTAIFIVPLATFVVFFSGLCGSALPARCPDGNHPRRGGGVLAHFELPTRDGATGDENAILALGKNGVGSKSGRALSGLRTRGSRIRARHRASSALIVVAVALQRGERPTPGHKH